MNPSFSAVDQRVGEALTHSNFGWAIGNSGNPPALPRIDIVHELPAERRYCAEGHGGSDRQSFNG